jgi:hypothetical protein
VEPRRRRELFAELLGRARVILPEVRPAQPDHEWLRGLFDIAARLETEVTRRLDRVPEKNRRNFLDWLGTRGRAARAARLVSVFRRAQPQPDQPLEPLLVAPRARLQAQTDDGSIVFETLQDLRIFAGGITALVAVTGDKIFQPPPGLFDPAAPPPVSMVRQLKSLATAGSDQIQVSPALGLEAGNILAISGQQYRINEVKGDLVTIEPPLAAEAAADAAIEQVTQFAPFGSASAATVAAPQDWQEHILYIGDDDLLNIEAPATIAVQSTPPLLDATWSYWGKVDKGDASKPSDLPAWQALTAAADNSGVALTKPYKGAIEKLEVNGQKIRVLRALRSGATTLRLSSIKLAIASQSCLDQAKTSSAAIAFEGVANITPIAAPVDFYPLGREPRLFDSFYIGCAEAFSKPGAEVTLSFRLPTPTLGPLAMSSADAADKVSLFAVGEDGLLYRLEADRKNKRLVWETLPRPADKPSKTTPSRVIALAQTGAPGLVEISGLPVIAVASGKEVWVWNHAAKVWLSLGEVKDSGTSAAAAAASGADDITAAVLIRQGAGAMAFALRNGALFEHPALDEAAAWSLASGAPPNLKSVAAIRSVHPLSAAFASPSELLAVDSAGEFHRFRLGTWTKLTIAPEPQLDPEVRPLAIGLANELLVAVAAITATGRELVAIRHLDSGSVTVERLPLDDTTLEPGLGFVPRTDGAVPTLVYLAGPTGQQPQLRLWRPGEWSKDVSIDAPWAERELRKGVAVLAAATDQVTPSLLAIPGKSADVLLTKLGSGGVEREPAQLSDCVVLNTLESAAQLVEISDADNKNFCVDLAGVVDFGDGTAAYRLSESFRGNPTSLRCRLFKLTDGKRYTGLRTTAGKLKIASDDHDAAKGKVIALGDHTYQISGIPSASGIVALDQILPVNISYEYRYVDELGTPSSGKIQPILDLAGLPASALSWLQVLGQIQATGAVPSSQTVVVPIAGWALLGTHWVHPPTPVQGKLTFEIAPTAFASATWIDYQIPANPALSWEYWNGKGWWKLDVHDHTDHLRRSDTVTFDVPGDIGPTDVVGRTNVWVRARLVGGDYGHESYKLHQSEPDNGGSTQTVERMTDTVRPPRVVSLTICFSSPAAIPARIITRDNLAWRDQSAANRAPNAVLELYQPFQEALAELKGSAGAGKQPEGCCDDAASTATSASCACQQAEGTKAADGCAACSGGATGSSSAAASAAADTAKINNALFLGTDVQLEKSSVRILWDVAEQQQDTELVIEALRDGTFAKVLPEDDTNGLAETGILTLSFDQSPGLSELFGQSLYWLRVKPKQDADNEAWKPVINRVCLNAAWAEAAESQEMEILGSSDGAPNQKVSVARPPVLDKSLELRVREPLTEDQVAELRRADAAAVRDDVPNMAGAWVRWTRVTDPLDCAAGDRVYALDEASGDISFGDALHGAVPPRGRDNIAAFFYKRGGGAKANRIAAGGALQLVSPLPGVEGVVAAVESAGGAESASIDETLRHAPALLWARDRAITSRDVERLALAYAPEIVQARCVAAPGRAASARLVVAVTGKDPRPSRATRHALERYLLDRAVPALDDGKRFLVNAPRTRLCRIEIALTIDSLDRAGTIEQAASDAIHLLLHWASGGLDGRGWPIGAVPAEDDVAAVLVDIPGVLGIGKVALLDAASGGDTPFPARVPDDTLVMLAPNGIKIDIAEDVA